ncbi:putative ankyrin repeat-containing domain-containing protein [Helianthus annuus]|nr:putative ankyrin repeat-containing domain-containing protein [Helianthus annuus]
MGCFGPNKISCWVKIGCEVLNKKREWVTMGKEQKPCGSGWVSIVLNELFSNLTLTYISTNWTSTECFIYGDHPCYTVRFKFENEFLRDIPEMDNKDRKILYEAAVEGWRWKAKCILKIHKSAATVAINENADTILHVAVEMGQNYFVEKLLGRTALHFVAMVGNTHAAQLLVQKRKELLVILDSKEESPLDIAYANKKINTYTYFLKCPDLSLSSDKCQENAILAAILVKQYGE